MINAGKMRQIVRLEQRATTQDASGDPTNTWSLFTQKRAEIVRTPGREVWSSEERLARVPTIFRLRYFEGVLPSMRLIWNAKVFNVLSVLDPDGLKVEMLITTEELVGDPQ